MRPLRILVVDDERVQRETLASILADHRRDQGVEPDSVAVAHDVPSAVDELRRGEFDVILTDLRIPGGSGIDVARRAAELNPESISVIMTAHADVTGVIEAMRAGVVDYLLKPLNVEALLRRLEIIRERRDLRVEVRYLRHAMTQRSNRGSLLGESAPICEVRRLVEQVAATRSTVLITGESGTGKEVAARQIHGVAAPGDQKFVAINCGALPEQLLESELFGHKRGAFTGAVADKQGLFAVANGGTLFLDEIGEMPRNLQVKLLRALQEREFVPVGDTRPVKVNLRVIAATNRDLAAAVEAGDFRRDLYYRINVVEIYMPALRDRLDDIPILAQHFIGKFSRELGRPMRTLTSEATRRLMAYHWPGNVRELENIIERAMILGHDEVRINVHDLPVGLHGDSTAGIRHEKLEDAVRVFSRAHISRVLAALGGDKREAARVLGMSLSSLYRKLEELGIPVRRTAEDAP